MKTNTSKYPPYNIFSFLISTPPRIYWGRIGMKALLLFCFVFLFISAKTFFTKIVKELKIFNFCVFLLMLSWQNGVGQSPVAWANPVGDATTGLLNGIPNPPTTNCMAGSTHTLTPNNTFQTGAVWSTTPIDLTLNNYVWEFNIYLGDDNEGADGIAFVLRTPASNAIGSANGASIGYGNGGAGATLIAPSIAIEFDDYFNNDISLNQNADIIRDHLDIIYNGLNCNLNDGAGFAATPLPNLEDGAWHQVVVRWNSCDNNQCLTVFLDGYLIATHCDPNMTSIVGNSPIWGGYRSIWARVQFSSILFDEF